MKSGYALVDLTGLDLTKGSTPQTVTGLFARLKEVMKYDKPMIGENAIWGTGVHMTPINFFAIQYDEHTIIATASTLQIYVTDASTGNVTIVNMVDANRTAKKKEV